MENVLRLNPDNSEITHIYYTTNKGTLIYLTKEDFEKMSAITTELVDNYYSGEAHDEFESLKDDIFSLLDGEHTLEYHKLKIAIHSKFIGDQVLRPIN